MARINSYTKITGAPADSDCFIIDSTQGTAGTRIVLWSVLKSVLTGIFAPKAHKHPGSDITSAVANANAATNDSVGQNIASTYVKELTVDGRTITVKRGNNTTFTFQTQDTNTTYPLADATKSGIMSASDWSLLHSLKTIDRPERIPANGDLNNIKNAGYYLFTWADSLSIKNKPVSYETRATILVLPLAGTEELDQVYISGYNTKGRNGRETIFIRHYGRGGGTAWDPWTDITEYPSASQSVNGLMSSSDKRKLDGLPTNIVGAIPLATQSVNGLMSSADKRKLDGLSSDVAGSIPHATPSRDGLMPKADKAKLDAIGPIPTGTIDGFFRI